MIKITSHAQRRILLPAFALLALFGACTARAADGDLAWATAISSSSVEAPQRAVFDDYGNVYTVGQYTIAADFDPGAGTTTLTPSSGRDFFIQKLDASGNFVWARGIGGTSTEDCLGVVVDSAGNVYATGYFGGTVDFDPGAGTYSLTASGSKDTYVLKLDSAGNFLWAAAFSGTSNFDQGIGIALDDAEDIYVTGRFGSTVDFDPGSGAYNLTANGTVDAFVVKLASDGTFRWATAVGTASGDTGNSIAVDSSGTVLIGGGNTAGFIAILDPLGAVSTFLSPVGTDVKAVAFDSSGNVHAAGYFSGTQDLDPGPGTANFTASGSAAGFALKLDSTANYVNAFTISPSSLGFIYGIAVDEAQNIFITGQINAAADFDPGAGTVTPTLYGSNDVFVAKYTSAHSLVWVETFGGTGGDQSRAVAADPQGNLVVAVDAQAAGDYDPGAGTLTLGGGGTDDVVTLKLQGPADTSAPQVASIVPLTSGPTNASSVAFRVRFKESVQNLDSAADFIVSNSGTASTGITLSGGPRVYTATVTGISGTGSFTLALNPGSDVKDFSNNALATSPTSSAVNIDNTAPTVSIGAPSATLVNPSATVSFPITIADATSINLTNSDVSLAYAGTAFGGTINVLNGTTATPTVEVSGVSATAAGNYTISIAAGVASDVVSNASLAAGPSAAVFVDAIAPTLSIASPSGGPISSSYGEVVFPVQVSGADTINLTPGNVSLNYTGTTAGGQVTVLDGNTGAPTVHVSQVSGDGSIGITIAAGVASDTAGNQTASATSTTATVDNTAPVYSNVSATPATAYAGQDVVITFLATEVSSNLVGVTVNGNPATHVAKSTTAVSYSYTVQPTDPLGPATIAIDGFDDAGNVGTLTDASALTIQAPPQEVPLVAWPVAVALAGLATAALRKTKK